MKTDKITALLMEALDYDMGPVPRSNITEALALLNPKGAVMEITDPVHCVPWKVVIVAPGAYYGRFDEREGRRACRNGDEALVEFWDCRYDHDFEHKAQFVQRYYLHTLQNAAGDAGLNLYGGTPSWQLSAGTFKQVRDWLRSL